VGRIHTPHQVEGNNINRWEIENTDPASRTSKRHCRLRTDQPREDAGFQAMAPPADSKAGESPPRCLPSKRAAKLVLEIIVGTGSGESSGSRQ
jgi:hypothetical protein